MKIQPGPGFVPIGSDPYAIGTGYYVLIDPIKTTGERCWLTGKEPRRAVKMARPRIKRYEDDSPISVLIRQLTAARDNGITDVRLGLPGEHNTEVWATALASDVDGETMVVYLHEPAPPAVSLLLPRD